MTERCKHWKLSVIALVAIWVLMAVLFVDSPVAGSDWSIYHASVQNIDICAAINAV